LRGEGDEVFFADEFEEGFADFGAEVLLFGAVYLGGGVEERRVSKRLAASVSSLVSSGLRI